MISDECGTTVDADSSLDQQALIEHFFAALTKVLVFTSKVTEETQHTKSRSERLVRGLVTAHMELSDAGVTTEIAIQRTKIVCGTVQLHEDSSEANPFESELSDFASRLHKSGLRALLFKPTVLSTHQAEQFVETLALVFQDEVLFELPVLLWRLGLPQLNIRSVDKLDTDFWKTYGGDTVCGREEFIGQFYFRVRQSLSPHIIKARGLFARKTLEGGVQGDSLSLESQFNMVFRRRDSSEQLKAGDWDERSYEPTIIEKLTATLKNSGDVRESESELRSLLRGQLKRHPAAADDKTLIKRAIAACRSLESQDNPPVTVELVSQFYQHIIEASVVIDDFTFFAEVFESIITAKEPVFSVQVAEKLSKMLATVAFVDSLQSIVRKNIIEFGLEKTRARLLQLLLHLEPKQTLKAITSVYPDINDDGTRMAFHDYLVAEGASALGALKPLFESRDAAIMTEGFGILSLIGPRAVPLIQFYVSDSFEERRQLAWKALQLASGSSAALLRDQHLENLEADRLERRKVAIEWLLTQGKDDAVFDTVAKIVRNDDFVHREREEQQLLIDLLTRSGGEKAGPVLADLPDSNSGQQEPGGTRRIADAASRIKKLEDE